MSSKEDKIVNKALKEDILNDLLPLYKRILNLTMPPSNTNPYHTVIGVFGGTITYMTCIQCGLNPQIAERAALSIVKNLNKISELSKQFSDDIRNNKERIYSKISYAINLLSIGVKEALGGVDNHIIQKVLFNLKSLLKLLSYTPTSPNNIYGSGSCKRCNGWVFGDNKTCLLGGGDPEEDAYGGDDGFDLSKYYTGNYTGNLTAASAAKIYEDYKSTAEQPSLLKSIFSGLLTGLSGPLIHLAGDGIRGLWQKRSDKINATGTDEERKKLYDMEHSKWFKGTTKFLGLAENVLAATVPAIYQDYKANKAAYDMYTKSVEEINKKNQKISDDYKKTLEKADVETATENKRRDALRQVIKEQNDTKNTEIRNHNERAKAYREAKIDMLQKLKDKFWEVHGLYAKDDWYGKTPNKAVLEAMRSYESGLMSELERAFPEFVKDKDSNDGPYLGQNALSRWWDRTMHFDEENMAPAYNYYYELTNKTKEDFEKMIPKAPQKTEINSDVLAYSLFPNLTNPGYFMPTPEYLRIPDAPIYSTPRTNAAVSNVAIQMYNQEQAKKEKKLLKKLNEKPLHSAEEIQWNLLSKEADPEAMVYPDVAGPIGSSRALATLVMPAVHQQTLFKTVPMQGVTPNIFQKTKFNIIPTPQPHQVGSPSIPTPGIKRGMKTRNNPNPKKIQRR